MPRMSPGLAPPMQPGDRSRRPFKAGRSGADGLLVGRPLLVACLPAGRPVRGRAWRADRRRRSGRTGHERSDVIRRVPRLSLPASLGGCRRHRPGPDHHLPGGTGRPEHRGPPCRGLRGEPDVEPDAQRPRQPHRPLVAQRRQPGRAARRRRGRPRRTRLRLPSERWLGPRRLALQRGRAGRLLTVGGAHRRQRPRHGVRRRRHRGHPHHGWVPGHRPQRRRPVVRPGDQPRDRPRAPQRRGGLADGRLLRRRVRRRGRLARPEHRRARCGQRSGVGGLPVVLRRLGVLDRGGGRSVRRRQQRDHQRRRLRARASPTGSPTPTGGTSASSRARATRGRGTRAGASSASTTRTRTSTGRRPPWASSSPAATSASPSATAATTPLPGAPRPPTRTRSSPSTRTAAWPGATPSTGSRPTLPPWPTCPATASSTWWRGRRPTPSTC